MNLKSLRKNLGLTQSKTAQILNIPLRTYVNYENDESKQSSIKYEYLYSKLSVFGTVDETHGILSVEKIAEKCKAVFEKYKVKFAYLFGSYAKGKATETSDVDLLVCSEQTGLTFFAMAEELRETLKKKIDLIDLNQLTNNSELTDEILSTGVKIYG